MINPTTAETHWHGPHARGRRRGRTATTRRGSPTDGCSRSASPTARRPDRPPDRL